MYRNKSRYPILDRDLRSSIYGATTANALIVTPLLLKSARAHAVMQENECYDELLIKSI